MTTVILSAKREKEGKRWQNMAEHGRIDRAYDLQSQNVIFVRWGPPVVNVFG